MCRLTKRLFAAFHLLAANGVEEAIVRNDSIVVGAGVRMPGERILACRIVSLLVA